MNEKAEMTKKHFIGWIFSSLMLATIVWLIVKAIHDVDSAIVYVGVVLPNTVDYRFSDAFGYILVDWLLQSKQSRKWNIMHVSLWMAYYFTILLLSVRAAYNQ